MSSKFNSTRAAYVKPSWCVKPPVIPLPPGLPYVAFLQGEGRISWNKADLSWVNLTCVAKDIKKTGAISYTSEVPIQGYVVHFSVSVNWSTKKISCGIFAYQGDVHQASAGWVWQNLPDFEWWRMDFEQPDFKIPNWLPSGSVDAWMSIWV